MTQPLWRIETVQRLMTLQAGKKRGLWLAASQRNLCSVQTQCKNEMVSHYDSHYHPTYPEAPCPVPVLIEGETSLLYQTLCDNLLCDNLSCTVLYFAGLPDDQPNGIIRPVLLPTNPSGFPQLPGDPHRGHIKSQRHHKAIPLPTNAQGYFRCQRIFKGNWKSQRHHEAHFYCQWIRRAFPFPSAECRRVSGDLSRPIYCSRGVVFSQGR